MWRAGLSSVLIAALALAGCGDSTSSDSTTTSTAQETRTSTAEPAKPVRYTLKVKADQGDNGIMVSGKTNLPNAAEISVTASRVFRNQREKENRTIHAGDGIATVENGGFSVNIDKINESDLSLGVPEVDGPVAEIDSDLTVCAEFRTGEEDNGKPQQPDAEVRAEVGDSGEALQGSRGVTKFGELTDSPSLWLEAQSSVEYPISVLDEITTAQGSQPEVHPLEKRFCA